MITTLTIAVDGTTSTKQCNDNDTLKHLQGEVGGYIELVSLAGGLDLYLDEDGITKGLSPNVVGSLVASTHGFNQGSFLLGPVVLTGGTDDEGETLGLTEAQVASLLAEVESTERWRK